MEHNTDRILWTVLILAIGVALFVIFRPATNNFLGQTTEKIQTVVDNVNGDTNDSSSTNTAVGTNLYTDTKNFDNLASWRESSYWTKTTDTYNGLAVMQTTTPWWGLCQPIHVKKGDVLTYSVYARNTNAPTACRIYWLLDSSSEDGYSRADIDPYNNTVTITNSWQRVSGTTVATSDGYLCPRLERITADANTLQIAGIKVEEGDKATPYTP